ncbi:uncharacterized protein LOC125441260 isoform X2 [Sphaerodactylus townsendi]|uniref:uncharacterized protein LOC125441260 isoform X2 n=1 Tax=Sphaerodactylus townsendi TaxID=933632 RepID=UPI0020266D6B|nr:uncharacterized protein LOC125441260 isoform X2 [Sphaerodactylus townsendi]
MSTQSEPENLVPEELENLEFEESENIEELENLEPEESENLEPEESEHLEPEESENLVPEKLEKLEPEESEKPEPEKLEKAPRKIYYCDICNIPCLSAMVMQTHIAGLRHKKRERAMKLRAAAAAGIVLNQEARPVVPVVYEESDFVKRPLSKNIRCLKDYVKDPNRDEPLIGLEYVVEVRFEGKRNPCYECQLCQFNTEVVPMIEHLTGRKHRKAYLIKHFPERGRKKPNMNFPKEDKAKFLKRIAKEIETEEGVKRYKCEGYDRPSVPSNSAKNRARWSRTVYKAENDPVQREKALATLDVFEITSDAEATQVINIAQSLSEALKAFCENKAALQHIKNLPPLLRMFPSEHRNTTNPGKEEERTQELASDGVAPLPGLLGKAPGLLGHAPSASNTCQTGQTISSFTVGSSDLARETSIRMSLAFQLGNFALGVNQWMKQFSQAAPVNFQPNPGGEKSHPSVSSQNSYPKQCHQGSKTQKYDNRKAGGRVSRWDNPGDSYSATGEYPVKCPSQGAPSWYNGGNSNHVPASLPAASNRLGWPQASGYQQQNLQANGGGVQFPFSGGRSYSDYQQQNTEMNNMMGQSSEDPSSSIMSQLRGKDPATLTRMLQELVPYYPDLQRIDIYALAQALSKLS